MSNERIDLALEGEHERVVDSVSPKTKVVEFGGDEVIGNPAPSFHWIASHVTDITSHAEFCVVKFVYEKKDRVISVSCQGITLATALKKAWQRFKELHED